MSKNIFMIEDEEIFALLLRSRLEAMGYKFRRTMTAEEGLEQIRVDHPNIILLDLMLPGMNGFELLKILKEDNDLKNIPVMILTARGILEDEKHCFSLGAAAYFIKPFSTSDFIQKLKELIGDN